MVLITSPSNYSYLRTINQKVTLELLAPTERYLGGPHIVGDFEISHVILEPTPIKSFVGIYSGY